MRIGVSYSAAPMQTFSKGGDAHLRKSLKFQKNVVNWIVEEGYGVLKLSPQLAPHLSSDHRPDMWGQVEECRKELAQWGEVIRRNKIRVMMSLPDRLSTGGIEYIAAVNHSNRVYSRRTLMWLQGYTSLLDTANLSHDTKIIVPVGRWEETHTWSKKMFIKRFKNMPEEMQERLALRNGPVVAANGNDSTHLFTVRDCLDIHEEVGIPLVHNISYSPIEELESLTTTCFKTWDVALPLVHMLTNRGRDAEQVAKEYMKSNLPNHDLLLDGKDGHVHAQRILHTS